MSDLKETDSNSPNRIGQTNNEIVKLNNLEHHLTEVLRLLLTLGACNGLGSNADIDTSFVPCWYSAVWRNGTSARESQNH